MLRDPWNNMDALRQYRGPVDTFGAKGDAIIPVKHAKALASQVAGARFTEIEGGHNEWSESAQLKITR